MSRGRGVQRSWADWDKLSEQVGGHLIRVEPPLRACMNDGASAACSAALRNLRNPFFNEDEPGAFQTTGWLDAFEAKASPWAVAATSAADIAAAVTFARDHGVRLVIKGTGHDYLGRSSAPDSLLIWTHHMRDVKVHDAFEIAGGPGAGGVPAITVAAGTRWLEAYEAATEHGRYVQGGGCTSVGAAGGFIQGGGFGSFSRMFGTAAGSVLEIEVVTANGEILIANEAQNQDLYWALRGGGGGTFGVVTKMTLRTHEMPATVGQVAGTITADGDAGYRRLIREFIGFYLDNLNNEHWGEQIRLAGDNSMTLSMLFLDVKEGDVRGVWRRFTDWIARQPDIAADIQFRTVPFAAFWDVRWWERYAPELVTRDDRAGQPPNRFWWTGDQAQVSQYLNAYKSRWLPVSLFDDSDADVLVDSLFQASRRWPFGIHTNKGLSGASPEAITRDRKTSINPSVFEAAALVIMSSFQYAYPGVQGHEPDRAAGQAGMHNVDLAMKPIRDVAPDAGTYSNEADFFEPDWQHSFWGGNYSRLLEVKRKYDPTNLFRVHHGVGSDT
jgi:FAD/FMN-containing dehydrogenase